MDSASIEKRLMQIFQDIFDTEALKSKEVVCQKNIGDWDSIGHIRLISAIENEFDHEIPYEEAVNFESLEKISAYLAKAL